MTRSGRRNDDGEELVDVDDVILAATGVSKHYPGVQALDDVGLHVREGTIHCLVGENGSGKSTLTKIIAGVVEPDSGVIRIGGHEFRTLTPRESLDAGVRVIYQDLALYPNLTVTENLTFSGSGSPRSWVRWGQRRASAVEALSSLGVDVDPAVPVEELSIAERQLVAIARAVSADARVVLMDEPTAALTHAEIDQLLDLVRRLRERDLSFVFITHKLREVMDVADDVTVLRNGKVVTVGPIREFTPARIAELMTGSEVGRTGHERLPEPEAPALLHGRGLGVQGAFQDVDIDLHAGRVTGIAGLMGSGRSEIGLALVGLLPLTTGQVRVHGEVASDLARDRRIQYVPEDRLDQGILQDWSIEDNIVLQHLDAIVGPRGFLDDGRKEHLAAEWRERLQIKAPDLHDPIATLSGGNQQRVMLARALAPRPEVLVLNNPTVGVDVGSRAEIHRLVREIAADGTAVLVMSDDLPELLDTCDDILVITRGRITGHYPTHDLDDDRLWRLTLGDEEPA